MTADEMRRAAQCLTEQARMYRAAGAPVAATERSILAAKLRAMAEVAEQPPPDHIYMGMCPDEAIGGNTRDPNCPACRLLPPPPEAGK